MINYKAHGQLLGAVEISKDQSNNKQFVILVAKTSSFGDPSKREYVVARYWDGSEEWFSGNYTSSLAFAAQMFSSKFMDCLASVKAMEEHYKGITKNEH